MSYMDKLNQREAIFKRHKEECIRADNEYRNGHITYEDWCRIIDNSINDYWDAIKLYI